MKTILLYPLLAALALASCKKEKAGPSAAAPMVIEIKNTAYAQPNLSVVAGTTVKWVNEDFMEHTVTALDSSFYSPSLRHGESYQFTFSDPGTFDYTCVFHSGMKGKVVVN